MKRPKREVCRGRQHDVEQETPAHEGLRASPQTRSKFYILKEDVAIIDIPGQ
jgi:hypothetical protein